MAIRIFLKSEIKQAENMLRILAFESARFWANSFLSSTFLYRGKIWYSSSNSNYAPGWHDSPNEEHEPISASQICKFTEEFLAEAFETIENWVQSDEVVAGVLSLQYRLHLADESSIVDKFNFGGWDREPYGVVLNAKKKADIVGPMSMESPYIKCHVQLCNGKIYLFAAGSKMLLMELDI